MITSSLKVLKKKEEKGNDCRQLILCGGFDCVVALQFRFGFGLGLLLDELHC